MNGAEFFMRHAGYRLLPSELKTDDPVRDADQLFSLSLPLHTGKTLRLSSCWMVITPQWVATSFKTLPEAGFRSDMERKTAIHTALKSKVPCMVLALGKRTMTARDLFVTYDPRATCMCSQGEARTYDATKEKTWTS
jgi:hypothetical protein